MNTTNKIPSKTQKEIVKEYLLTGKRASAWQMIRMHRIANLAQRIHELRRSGLTIESELVSKEGHRYSEYWLDRNIIKSYQAQTNTGPSQSAPEVAE